jgi:hypothetical protein
MASFSFFASSRFSAMVDSARFLADVSGNPSCHANHASTRPAKPPSGMSSTIRDDSSMACLRNLRIWFSSSTGHLKRKAQRPDFILYPML